MKLEYVQRKSHVANILWAIGNGLAFSHFATKEIFLGNSFGDSYWLCKNDEIILAVPKLKKIADFTIKIEKELGKNLAHVKKIRKKFDKKSKKVLRLINKLKNKDLEKLSNKKLNKYYQQIFQVYKEVYHYGEPIAFAARNFSEKLKTYFKSIKGSEEEFNELITPIEKSFLQKERQALLKIALSKNKIDEQIKKHKENFEWVPYDYGVIIFTEKHFKEEIKKIQKKTTKEIKEELDFLKKYSKSMKNKHKKIISKYRINNKHIKLFETVQISSYLLDFKKELFTMLHWYSTKLFLAIEKRLDITNKQFQFMLPNEIEESLINDQKIEQRILNERNKGIIIKIKENGAIELRQGKEAQKIIKNFNKEGKERKKEFLVKGMTAFKGFTKGKVRILMNAKISHTMKHGDILIAPMTSPDYIVAIRKAAAIVTDEGGMLCHASIVSRELKIPCIVGTKTATKTFKDGDIVEVDANKGIIRRIK